MDRRQYAVKKGTAYRNLSALECDGAGVTDNTRSDFERLYVDAVQKTYGFRTKRICMVRSQQYDMLPGSGISLGKCR